MTNVVIPTFPADQQAELTAAANAWRLPYWDWAEKKSRGSSPPDYNVPLIVLPKTIKVTTPTGQTTINNPMYDFTTPKPMGDYGVNSLLDIEGIPVRYTLRRGNCTQLCRVLLVR
jgi:tyrosinase